MKYFVPFLLIISVTFGYFDPMSIGTNADSIAKGATGFNKTASSVFENPGALRFIDGISVSSFESRLIEDTKYGAYALVLNAGIAKIGVGYISMGVENIPDTALDGFGDPYVVSYFDYLDRAIYGSILMGHVGLTVKAVQTNIGNITARYINFDIGTIIENGPFEVSIVARNAGFMFGMNYSNSAKEMIPLEASISLKHTGESLTLFGQLSMVKGVENKNLKAVGVTYSFSGLEMVKFNAGYAEKYSISKVYGILTYGMTIDYQGIQIAYAQETSELVSQGTNQYVSMGIKI